MRDGGYEELFVPEVVPEHEPAPAGCEIVVEKSGCVELHSDVCSHPQLALTAVDCGASCSQQDYYCCYIQDGHHPVVVVAAGPPAAAAAHFHRRQELDRDALEAAGAAALSTPAVPVSSIYRSHDTV